MENLVTKEEENKFSKTPFVVPVIVDMVLESVPNNITEEEQLWFKKHAYYRTIYCYFHNEIWQKALKSKNGREVLIAFIKHWFEAYIKDPQQYKSRLEIDLKKKNRTNETNINKSPEN